MKRKLSKIYTLYTTIFFILIALLPYFSFGEETEIIALKNNIKVIDGDSLEINEHRIRLTGIDAPEFLQTCKDSSNKKYKCGIKSTEFLKNLIKDQVVTCQSHGKDQYNRLLCTCYIGNTNLNQEMVKNGHAIPYLDATYNKDEEFAKHYKLGIWNGNFMHPRLFRLLNEK